MVDEHPWIGMEKDKTHRNGPRVRNKVDQTICVHRAEGIRQFARGNNNVSDVQMSALYYKLRSL